MRLTNPITRIGLCVQNALKHREQKNNGGVDWAWEKLKKKWMVKNTSKNQKYGKMTPIVSEWLDFFSA
jgi:hypothetical protein